MNLGYSNEDLVRVKRNAVLKTLYSTCFYPKYLKCLVQVLFVQKIEQKCPFDTVRGMMCVLLQRPLYVLEPICQVYP